MMSTLFDYENIMKNHDAAIRREAAEEAIAKTVRMCKRMNISMDDTIENIVCDYDYTEEEAIKIVENLWNEIPVTINIKVAKED